MSELTGPWIERFLAVRAATEALAAPLSAEDQLLQSMPDCSPTKWHRAHTTWFFEELLLGPEGQEPYDPRYRYLFNSYYEALGPRHPRPARGLLSRPSLNEVAHYRRVVDERVVRFLETADTPTWRRAMPLLALGLAHEEQHQELILTDILHAFSLHPLEPAYRPPPPAPPPQRAPAPLAWVDFPGGLSRVGHEGPGFAFDNEGPAHLTWLTPFALASRPLLVADVLAFVRDGGYRQARWWLSDGWAFVQANQLEAPRTWLVDGGAATALTPFGRLPLDPAAPAAPLSYYEADALARYFGARLPAEAEWEVAAQAYPPQVGNFRESGALWPQSLEQGPGLSQLFGDVWEWTASAYAPYPGFRPVEGAVGEYNGKFMVSQLVLKGGSAYSPRGHLRASYRNFWPPATRFQLTGARLAKDLP